MVDRLVGEWFPPQHRHADKSFGTRLARPEGRTPKILGSAIETKWLWCHRDDDIQ